MDGPDVCGIEFDRDAARTPLGHDAAGNDHPLVGVQELIGLEPPLAPRLTKHGDQPGHSLSPSKDRLSFRIVGRQVQLELPVEIAAEKVIDLIRRDSMPRGINAYTLRTSST